MTLLQKSMKFHGKFDFSWKPLYGRYHSQCIAGIYTTFISKSIVKYDDWTILNEIVGVIFEFSSKNHEIPWKIRFFVENWKSTRIFQKKKNPFLSYGLTNLSWKFDRNSLYGFWVMRGTNLQTNLQTNKKRL